MSRNDDTEDTFQSIGSLAQKLVRKAAAAREAHETREAMKSRENKKFEPASTGKTGEIENE